MNPWREKGLMNEVLVVRDVHPGLASDLDCLFDRSSGRIGRIASP